MRSSSSLRSSRSSSSNSSPSIKKSVSFKLDAATLPPQPPLLPPHLPRSALHELPASAQPLHMLASTVRFMELQRPG